jgi:hypothetical protein
MLTNHDLSNELNTLARAANEAAAAIKSTGDLPARQLAAGYIEAHRLGERLAKLARQLGSSSGRQGQH